MHKNNNLQKYEVIFFNYFIFTTLKLASTFGLYSTQSEQALVARLICASAALSKNNGSALNQ